MNHVGIGPSILTLSLFFAAAAARCTVTVALPYDLSPRAAALLDAAPLSLACARAARGGCVAEVPLASRAATLRVYDAQPGAPLGLLFSRPLPAAAAGCAALPAGGGAVGGPRVGLLYEGWQAYAANASRAVRAAGGDFVSVEDVLRSGGNLSLADMWEKYGVSSWVAGFDWQARTCCDIRAPLF